MPAAWILQKNPFALQDKSPARKSVTARREQAKSILRACRADLSRRSRAKAEALAETGAKSVWREQRG
jgi:hypothetical protein